jgi:hypothetical protein
MSEDIYEGLCRDCFRRKKELIIVDDQRIMNPFVPGMKLCNSCIVERRLDLATRRPIRELGVLLEDKRSEWIDLPPLSLVSRHCRSQRLTVQIKLRIPTVENKTHLDGGNVRVKIGDNLWWEQTEYMDCERRTINRMIELARSGVRLILGRRFAPNMDVVEP